MLQALSCIVIQCPPLVSFGYFYVNCPSLIACGAPLSCKFILVPLIFDRQGGNCLAPCQHATEACSFFDLMFYVNVIYILIKFKNVLI